MRHTPQSEEAKDGADMEEEETEASTEEGAEEKSGVTAAAARSPLSCSEDRGTEEGRGSACQINNTPSFAIVYSCEKMSKHKNTQ